LIDFYSANRAHPHGINTGIAEQTEGQAGQELENAGSRPPRLPTATSGVLPGRSPGLQGEPGLRGNHLPMPGGTVAHQIAVDLLTVAGAASDWLWHCQAHRFPVSPAALCNGHLKKVAQG